MEILIEDRAIKEIIQITRWYKKESELVGARFEKELKATFQKLTRTDVGYRKVFRNIEMISMKPFPYSIYFITTESFRKILAILHQKRDQQEALQNLSS